MSFLNQFIIKLLTTPIAGDNLGSRIAGEAESLSQTAAGGAGSLEAVVNQVIKVAIPLGVLSAVALFSWAGYTMITSAGNPDKLNEARDVATNAIIGFALVALCVVILLLIKNALGLPTD